MLSLLIINLIIWKKSKIAKRVAAVQPANVAVAAVVVAVAANRSGLR